MNQVIKAGEVLGDHIRTPNQVALLAFSAATWNMHRIHFDRDYAHSEGHRDVVVHGSLQANWLVERVLAQWPAGVVRSLAFRNVSTAYVGEEFRVKGTVQDVQALGNDTQVTLALSVEGPSGTTTVGTVGLLVPSPSGSGAV